MGTPTRFKNGVTNAAVNSIFGNLPIPDVTINGLTEYFNDFHTYAAGDWTVTASGSGSSAISAGLGGRLALTWGTSGTQGNTLTSGGFSFNAASTSANGSQFWFSSCIINPANASAPNFLVGAIKGNPTSISDGVYFTKAAAGLPWRINIKAAAASTTTVTLPTSTNAANNSVQELGYYYDGRANPTLFIYVNDVMVGTFGANGSLGTLANLPASTILLNPSAAIGTAAGPLLVDYLFCACEIPGRL